MGAKFSLPLTCMDCEEMFDADVYVDKTTASDTLLTEMASAIRAAIHNHDKHSCKGPEVSAWQHE